MQPLDLFAHLVRDLCSTMLEAEERSLEDRVTSVWRALGAVVATGAALPVVAGTAPPFGSSPLTNWPGLGSFEAYWRETEEGPLPMRASDTLVFVFQQLWCGLEAFESGEEERAAGIWGAGFETSWGPAAMEVLGVLHTAVVGYRTDRRRAVRTQRSASPLVMVAHRTRDESVATGRPTLGLRIQPVGGGVEVLAVHPAGPAARHLQVGDVVLAVDGRSLDGLDETDAGPALTGPIGTDRVYEVYRDGETVMVRMASASAASL
jgi:hypothetical protein